MGGDGTEMLSGRCEDEKRNEGGRSPRMRTTATTTRAQMEDRKPGLVCTDWSQMWTGVHGERRLRPPKDKLMSQKTTLECVRASRVGW